MQQKKLVTIGIPAHNEAKTIGKLLDSILIQKEGNYKFEKIIIFCDGCTDKTVAVVKEYSSSNPLIKLKLAHIQRGKTFCLNYFYRHNTSDIFVSIDADCQLANTEVISNLVKNFNGDVGLVGGCDQPFLSQTLIAKIAETWVLLWFKTRQRINKGISIHNHHGQISAVYKGLAQQLVIPAQVISDDQFVYLQAIKLGFTFRFAQDAVIYYKLPQRIGDYFRQSTRFLSMRQRVSNYFDRSTQAQYYVPFKYKLRALVYVFAKKPLLLPLAFLTQICIKLVGSRFNENYTKGYWTSITSSK